MIFSKEWIENNQLTKMAAKCLVWLEPATRENILVNPET
jgi:hypothetical protein